MDRKEYFKILKEIASVSSKVESLKINIKTEQSRISKIEEIRKSRQEELTENVTALDQSEKQFGEFEFQLNQVSRDLQKKTADLDHADHSFQNQILKAIEELKIQKSSLEAKMLHLMEEMDQIVAAIKDSRHFLDGSEVTLKNLTEEIQKINQDTKVKMKSFEDHIQSLMESLPMEFQKALQNLFKLNLAKTAFTQIDDHKCRYCAYSMSRVDEADVEERMQLINCSSCRRLFIPINSLY